MIRVSREREKRKGWMGMKTYEWMGKKHTKEDIQKWIDFKRGELKIEEKLRGRGTNFYQGTLKDIKEAEALIK